MKNFLTILLTILMLCLLFGNSEGFTEVSGFAGSQHPALINEVSFQSRTDITEYKVKRSDLKITTQQMGVYTQALTNFFCKTFKIPIFVLNNISTTIYTKDSKDSNTKLVEIVFLASVTDATTPYGISIYTIFLNDDIISVKTQPQEHVDYISKKINPPYDEDIHDFPSFDDIDKGLYDIFKGSHKSLITDKDLSKRITDATSHINSNHLPVIDPDQVASRFSMGSPVINIDNARSTMLQLNQYRDDQLTTAEADDIIDKWKRWNPNTRQYDNINSQTITTPHLSEMIAYDSCGGEGVLDIPYDKITGL